RQALPARVHRRGRGRRRGVLQAPPRTGLRRERVAGAPSAGRRLSIGRTAWRTGPGGPPGPVRHPTSHVRRAPETAPAGGRLRRDGGRLGRGASGGGGGRR